MMSICEYVKKYKLKKVFWGIVLFLIVFCFITNFSFLNLTIAKCLDSMALFKQEEIVLKFNVYTQDLFTRREQNSFPRSSKAIKALIRFYNNQNEYEKLIVLYEYYLNRDEYSKLTRSVYYYPEIDKAGVYSDLANIYFMAQQYENAIKYYKKAIELKGSVKALKSGSFEDLAEEYNGLVEVYLALGDIKQATLNLNKSFEIISKHSENVLQTMFSTYCVASKYYLKLGDYKNAEIYATKLFLNIPSDTLPIKSYMRHQIFYLIIANSQMGDVKFAQKQYKESEKYYKKVRFLTEEYYGKDSQKYVCASLQYLNVLSKIRHDDVMLNRIENEILHISKKIMRLNKLENNLNYVNDYCGKY